MTGGGEKNAGKGGNAFWGGKSYGRIFEKTAGTGRGVNGGGVGENQLPPRREGGT